MQRSVLPRKECLSCLIRSDADSELQHNAVTADKMSVTKLQQLQLQPWNLTEFNIILKRMLERSNLKMLEQNLVRWGQLVKLVAQNLSYSAASQYIYIYAVCCKSLVGFALTDQPWGLSSGYLRLLPHGSNGRGEKLHCRS
jgi:hypothetical protein